MCACSTPKLSYELWSKVQQGFFDFLSILSILQVGFSRPLLLELSCRLPKSWMKSEKSRSYCRAVRHWWGPRSELMVDPKPRLWSLRLVDSEWMGGRSGSRRSWTKVEASRGFMCVCMFLIYVRVWARLNWGAFREWGKERVPLFWFFIFFHEV